MLNKGKTGRQRKKTSKTMMKAKKTRLGIEKTCASWAREQGLERRLRMALGVTLASLPKALLPVAERAEFTLLLTTDNKMRALNRDFRGIDKPTNVLSFPFFSCKDLVRIGKDKDKNFIHVGDIALAFATTQREAKQEGKAFRDHATHLAVHGALHLFGFDHDTPARAAKMEKLEKDILSFFDITDPYAEKAL